MGMSRAPFNVLVLIYRRDGDSLRYALLQRADAGYWHTVSGGAEDDETPLQAARREMYEETGLSPDSDFVRLDTTTPVPVSAYRGSFNWPPDLYVIPQYCFGAQAHDDRLVLSPEHTDYQWLDYEVAHRLIEYEGTKIALWELDRRLRGLGPRD
jgi:dATP pyrophosphohydrolase